MRKNIFGILIALVLCFGFCSMNTKAAGPRDGEIVDGSLLTSNESATDRFDTVARGQFLAFGTSAIVRQPYGVLYVNTSTYCFQDCDKVKAYVYLERLEGDNWVPVTHNYLTETDTYIADNGFYVTVDSGYYYRLCGTHAAIMGNYADTNHTQTDGLFLE